MNNNKGNNNAADKTGDVMSWVIIIILMFAFPPLGWILLFIKLGFFASKKAKKKQIHTVDVNSINKVNSTGNFSNAGNVNNFGNVSNAGNVNNFGNFKKISRTRLDKKTGKGISFILLLVSIGFVIAGIGALSNWISGGFANTTEMIFGGSYLLGGVIAFLSRNIVSHQYVRYKNYFAYMEGRGIIPISEFSQISGLSSKKVTGDLQAMINNGYLTPGAYIDYGLDCLVLSPEEAQKLRAGVTGAQRFPAAVISGVSGGSGVAGGLGVSGGSADGISVTQDAAILAELREVNSFINDSSIAAKVNKLIELTEKIFKIVEDNPDKQPQLRRFSSYYLPTTLKLVRSYTTLEKQGVKGENIMSTKKSIGDILDTLSTGFEQQLDQLFKSDAIDIAADINVLENLMHQDGLSGEKSEFQVTAGGTF